MRYSLHSPSFEPSTPSISALGALVRRPHRPHRPFLHLPWALTTDVLKPPGSALTLHSTFTLYIPCRRKPSIYTYAHCRTNKNGTTPVDSTHIPQALAAELAAPSTFRPGRPPPRYRSRHYQCVPPSPDRPQSPRNVAAPLTPVRVALAAAPYRLSRSSTPKLEHGPSDVQENSILPGLRPVLHRLCSNSCTPRRPTCPPSRVAEIGISPCTHQLRIPQLPPPPGGFPPRSRRNPS